MPVLDPEALDQLGRCVSRFGELLAATLAERCRQRVDLPHGGSHGHDQSRDRATQL
jgi:hypothetical protein